jgi:hypothetical protein
MKSIIFSGEMVRALIAGRKTQTRRTVKNLEYLNFRQFDSYERWQLEYRFTKPIKGTSKGLVVSFANEAEAKSHFIADFCKYQVGDFLWVREAWNESYTRHPFTNEKKHKRYIYKAEMETQSTATVLVCGKHRGKTMADLHKWKSPIHMPQAASRITLKISDIRIERIQEIGYGDIRAEGIHLSTSDDHLQQMQDYCDYFRSLWSKINGAESWNNDDWVFVYEFQIVEVKK